MTHHIKEQLTEEDQVLIDGLLWGMFYQLSDEEFHSPKMPWNRPPFIPEP